MELVLATGIPFSVWESEDELAVATALQIFAERAEE